jgi:hypothetical protein
MRRGKGFDISGAISDNGPLSGDHREQDPAAVSPDRKQNAIKVRAMRIEVIANPSKELFLELVRTSSEHFLASPFIKTNVAQMFLGARPKHARTAILTSYKLTNFYRSSSDLEALRTLIQHDVDVRNFPRLHAKIYIFNSDRAIVTSANLTLGGLQANYECGVLIEDSPTVSKLRSDFLRIFKDKESVSVITEEIVSTTEEILAKVPQEKRPHFEKSEKDLFPLPEYEPEDDLYTGGVETILNSLSGWRLDTFKVLMHIPGNGFRLEEVYARGEVLKRLHPANRNIEAKIRQQLQQLRDLGLVEFVSPGIYRKLWRNE